MITTSVGETSAKRRIPAVIALTTHDGSVLFLLEKLIHTIMVLSNKNNRDKLAALCWSCLFNLSSAQRG